MGYGINDEIQKLVWGGIKSSTANATNAANNQATTIVNIILGLNENIADPTQRIINITNILASEILKNPKQEIKVLMEEAEIMVGQIKDQGIPSEAGPWGNIRFF